MKRHACHCSGLEGSGAGTGACLAPSLACFQLQGQPGQQVLCFYFLLLQERMNASASIDSISALFISRGRINKRKFLSKITTQFFSSSANCSRAPSPRQSCHAVLFPVSVSCSSGPQEIELENHSSLSQKSSYNMLLEIFSRKLFPPSKSNSPYLALQEYNP